MWFNGFRPKLKLHASSIIPVMETQKSHSGASEQPEELIHNLGYTATDRREYFKRIRKAPRVKNVLKYVGFSLRDAGWRRQVDEIQGTKCKNSQPLTLALFYNFFSSPPGGKEDKLWHKYRLQYKQNGLSTIMSLAEALSTETPTWLLVPWKWNIVWSMDDVNWLSFSSFHSSRLHHKIFHNLCP